MDQLELRLTYKEREDFKKPFKARGLEIKGVDYYHCEVRIGDELYTSYVNHFDFFFFGQDLREQYVIVYDVEKFLANEIENASIINEQQLPKNIILAFEYALIKHYIKHSKHHCFFTNDNSAKINYLFQMAKLEKLKNQDVVKYKISPNPNISDVIRDLESLAKKRCTIRLDGNRALDPHQIESLFYNLRDEVINQIEYIEEPFDDTKKWQELAIAKEIPQAIDESFDFEERDKIDESINKIIIKFGVNCSVFEYFKLKRDKRAWDITITSGFEAPKLFNLAIHLASRERCAAGLSTFMFFKNELKLVKDFKEEESTITAHGLN